MSHVLILGATSDIAAATARAFAAEGHSLCLAARREEPLAALAADLRLRYNVDVQTRPFDALLFAHHAPFFEDLDPRPDIAVVAFGYLGDELRARRDPEEAERILRTNFTGAASILDVVAGHFEAHGGGSIVGISSVAGDRGRKSNYHYGSAKAGLTTYLAGLRHRLAGSGVHVMTVKPGFVRTRMTEGLALPGALTAEPEQVARDILKGLKRKRRTIYTLWMWRYVMWVIRLLPEPLFLRTNL
jgi:short-subunit dehydrogenase